jgi:hypothetical protein
MSLATDLRIGEIAVLSLLNPNRAIAGKDGAMPPTDDDQKSERESRIDEMIRGHQREHPAESPQDRSSSETPPASRSNTRGSQRNGTR